MSKITPKMILDAYEKTGYKPIHNEYVTAMYACPLSVLAIANEPLVADQLKNFREDSHVYPTFRVNCVPDDPLTDEYINAFIAAIDGGYDGGDEEGAVDAREVCAAIQKKYGLRNFAPYLEQRDYSDDDL